MLVRFTVSVPTSLSPERVTNGFTDFSEKRLVRWPALSKTLFKVHSVGSNFADVTEGSDVPMPVWARETYDWSQAGVVRWSVQESSFSRPGHAMEVHITAEGSGSRVVLEYERNT